MTLFGLHTEICTWIITKNMKTKIHFNGSVVLIALNGNQIEIQYLKYQN